MNRNYIARVAIVFFLFLVALSDTFLMADGLESSSSRFNKPMFTVHQGLLTARKSVDIPAPLLSQVLTISEDGTHVNTGDVICTMSEGNRRATLKLAQNDLNLSEIKYRKAFDLEPCERKIAELGLKKAELEFEKAREEVSRAFETRQWQRMFENEMACDVFELEARVYGQRTDALKKLQSQGFSSKVKLLDAECEKKVSALEASFTSKLFPWLKKSYDESEYYAAVQNLENASEALNYARVMLGISLFSPKASIALLKDGISRDQMVVGKLEAEIASLTVRANASGIIERKNSFNGSTWEKLAPGDQIFPGFPFISILDTDGYCVTFQVDQSQSEQIVQGKKILFRPDASPEFIFTGITSESKPLAAEVLPSDLYGEREVVVKGALDKSLLPEGLMPGFSGTVFMMTDAKSEDLRELVFPNRMKLSDIVRRPMKRILTISGEVYSARRSLINSPYEGKLEWIIEDGRNVVKNESIARIETYEIQRNLDETTEKIKSKKEQLELHKQKCEIEIARASRKLEITKGAMEVAEIEHRILLERRDEDKIITLRKSQELIDSKLQMLTETAKLESDLHQKGLKSEIDVLAAKLEVSRQKRESEINRYKLETEESGATKRQILLSEISKKLLQIDWLISMEECEQTKKTLAFDKLILESEIEKLQLQEIASEEKIRKANILSPRDGIVLLPEVFQQTGQLTKNKIGDQLHPWIPFMHVADPLSLQIKLKMSEMDAKFVEVGKEVKISLQSAPGKTFRGWIEKIGLIATLNNSERQDSVVEVYVSLINPNKGVKEIDTAFRPGATCEVVIELYNIPVADIVKYDSVMPHQNGPQIMFSNGKYEPVNILFSDGIDGFVLADSESKRLGLPVREISR
ncbi:MAG: HlyD family efflux transporter periplasmic adaptor subunit [Candidatus Riflebacteria bacterium]|nr:HlyD family efflux transporter periplasmic adaptor subunit [Candidatus Riflebacteria bacterium]